MPRDRLLQALPWFAPLVVAAVWAVHADAADELLVGAIGAAVVLVASTRPDVCVLALLAFMPFQLFVPALLYNAGVPEGVLRPLTAWREVLAVALALAAGRALLATRRRVDAVDVAAVGFVALVTAYALVPRLFAADAPTEISTRALAWRSSALFVAVLLAARHAGFGIHLRERAGRVLCATAVVVAGFALWELVDSSSWNHFAVHVIGVNTYKFDVLGDGVPGVVETRTFGSIGGREFVRVSSLIGSPLPLGHYLVIPLVVAVARWLRAGGLGIGTQIAVIGAALLATQTRSALVGAIVGVVLLLVVTGRAGGAIAERRGRSLQLLLAVGLALLPLVAVLGLADRVTDDASNEAHLQSFADGIETLVDHPLGTGLGTSAGVGQRVGTSVTVAENYYLQVADEVGVVGGLAFLALVGLVLRRLWRGHAAPDPFVAPALAGFAGISVAAAFLHAYTNQTVAWTAFLVAGLGLGAVDHEPDPATTYPASLPHREPASR